MRQNLPRLKIFMHYMKRMFPYNESENDWISGSKVFKAKIKYSNKSLILSIFIGLAAALFLMILSPWLIDLIFGKDYESSVRLLKIMAPMIIAGGCVHMFLQQGLLILRKDRIYMVIIVFTGISSIILNLILIKAYDVTGAAIVRLITEIIIALAAAIMFYKNINKA